MAMFDVERALHKFMEENNCDGIFLMGTKDGVQDYGIIVDNDDDLSDKIVHTLQMKLELREIWHLRSIKFGGRFFDPLKGQSRKVIMPIVQEAVNIALVE